VVVKVLCVRDSCATGGIVELAAPKKRSMAQMCTWRCLGDEEKKTTKAQPADGGWGYRSPGCLN